MFPHRLLSFIINNAHFVTDRKVWGNPDDNNGKDFHAVAELSSEQP
jgi:hypothetical protein